MSMDEQPGREQAYRRDQHCDWPQYKYYFLQALDRMEKAISDIREDVGKVEASQVPMKENLAGLNVKAGFWGAVSGAGTILVYLLLRGKY